ncbi:MAG: TPM domain-containing protein [Butyricicoccus sp.]|nr:TPM domain-containing protein [Butyricicoccus sp.]
MRKICILLSMLTFLVCMMITPASALSGVYDDAGTFSSDQIADLSDQIAVLEAQTDGWEFAVVTTNDAEGKSAQNYADDRWDTDDHEHGALVLFDFDNGEVYISCAGDAMGLYSDDRIETILDEMFLYIPDGEYYEGAVAFLNRAEYYYTVGLESDEPIYHVQPGESAEDYADDPIYEYIEKPVAKNYFLIIAVSLISGLAAGGIAVGVTMAKYRLKFPDRSYEIDKHAQLELTEHRDDVIGHMITHRRIPRDDDHGGGHSGGGTTVHHSSGGRVHSGGGRRM